MTRRIAHLIEEQENISKLLRTRNLDVEVKRTKQDSQKTEAPTPDRELINELLETKLCGVVLE